MWQCVDGNAGAGGCSRWADVLLDPIVKPVHTSSSCWRITLWLKCETFSGKLSLAGRRCLGVSQWWIDTVVQKPGSFLQGWPPMRNDLPSRSPTTITTHRSGQARHYLRSHLRPCPGSLFLFPSLLLSPFCRFFLSIHSKQSMCSQTLLSGSISRKHSQDSGRGKSLLSYWSWEMSDEKWPRMQTSVAQTWHMLKEPREDLGWQALGRRRVEIEVGGAPRAGPRSYRRKILDCSPSVMGSY